MRGGSLPLLAWGAVLAVLMILNAIWTTDAIQVATFGFAILMIWGAAAGFALSSRWESLKRGAPGRARRTQAIPTGSLGAVLVAVSVAAVVFGLAYGRFLIFFGGGLLILSLGILAREVWRQRQAQREWLKREAA